MEMTLEQIRIKSEYGDFNTLGKMLDVPPTTARARLLRGDEETRNLMITIIENREKLIHDHQTQNQNL